MLSDDSLSKAVRFLSLPVVTAKRVVAKMSTSLSLWRLIVMRRPESLRTRWSSLKRSWVLSAPSV